MSDNLDKNSSNDKIIVLFKEAGKEAVLKRIENTIENKEKLIGGKFKVKKYGDVLLCYREDAQNLMPNITIYSDTYNGNIFFTGIDNFSNLISLTKEQCLTLFKELKNTSFNYKENDDGKMTLVSQKTKEKKARVKMKVNWDDVCNAKTSEKMKVILEEHIKTEDITNEEVIKKIKEMFKEVQIKNELSTEDKIAKMNEFLDKIETFVIKKNQENKQKRKEIPVFDANETLKLILSIQNSLLRFIKDNTVE